MLDKSQEMMISATDDIGRYHIGHTKPHIGHKQSQFRPYVDIGHTISATYHFCRPSYYCTKLHNGMKK